MDYFGRLLGRIYGERPAVEPDMPPVFSAQEPLSETDDPLAAFAVPRIPPRMKTPLPPPPMTPPLPETPVTPPASTFPPERDDAPPTQPRAVLPPTPLTPPVPRRADPVSPLPNEVAAPTAHETHIERLTERVLRVETERERIERQTIIEGGAPSIPPTRAAREEVRPPEMPPARSVIQPNLPPVMPPSSARQVSAPREAPPAPQKVINVRIGRIDVRANTPSAPAPKPNGGRKKPNAISLDDYLRDGGKP